MKRTIIIVLIVIGLGFTADAQQKPKVVKGKSKQVTIQGTGAKVNIKRYKELRKTYKDLDLNSMKPADLVKRLEAIEKFLGVNKKGKKK